MFSLFSLFIITGGRIVYYTNNPSFFEFISEKETTVVIQVEIDKNLVAYGIHFQTGLIEAVGLMTVANNCTNCHSSN